MQFISILLAFAAAAAALPVTLAQNPNASVPVSVTYNQFYDTGSVSLDAVACSDGPNGLESESPQFTTLGSLPGFPYVGGAFAVEGWDSANCGTCWQLEYYDGTTITVVAVDVAEDGFNLSLEAMDALTRGEGQFLGRVNATATQVAKTDCGFVLSGNCECRFPPPPQTSVGLYSPTSARRTVLSCSRVFVFGEALSECALLGLGDICQLWTRALILRRFVGRK